MLMIEMMTIVQSERWTFYGHRMSVSMIEVLCICQMCTITVLWCFATMGTQNGRSHS